MTTPRAPTMLASNKTLSLRAIHVNRIAIAEECTVHELVLGTVDVRRIQWSVLGGNLLLPRNLGAGGGGAETIVSSFGHATVSSTRTSTTTLAGITLRVSQRA